MPQRKTRKLSVRAYFPLAMSASRFFNVSSSSPRLAGVPFGQTFVGQVTVEVGEAACAAASERAVEYRNRAPTRLSHTTGFFITLLRDPMRGGPKSQEGWANLRDYSVTTLSHREDIIPACDNLCGMEWSFAFPKRFLFLQSHFSTRFWS